MNQMGVVGEKKNGLHIIVWTTEHRIYMDNEIVYQWLKGEKKNEQKQNKTKTHTWNKNDC